MSVRPRAGVCNKHTLIQAEPTLSWMNTKSSNAAEVLQDMAVHASSISVTVSAWLLNACFFQIICVFDLTTICMESDYKTVFCPLSQQVVLDVWILHMSCWWLLLIQQPYSCQKIPLCTLHICRNTSGFLLTCVIWSFLNNFRALEKWKDSKIHSMLLPNKIFCVNPYSLAFSF